MGSNTDHDADALEKSNVRAGFRKRAWLGAEHRGIFTVGDQAIYSLGNLGIGILVLRAGSAAQFGDFSLAFMAVNLLVVACRGFTGEYLLQTPSGKGHGQAGLKRCMVAAGIVAAGISLLIPVTDESLRLLIEMTCVVTPIVLIEDYATRYVLIWARRSDLAALSDTVWLGAQFAVWVLLPNSMTPAARGLAAWGAAALISAVPVGPIVYRVLRSDGASSPRNVPPRSFDRKRAWHMSGDNFVAASPAPLSTAVVTLVASISIAGILRGGQLAFNSITVAMYGVRSVALRESGHNKGAYPSIFVLGLIGITIAWLVLLLLVPEHVMRVVFGAEWPRIREIVVPIALGRIIMAVVMGVTVSARSKAQTKKVLIVRIATASLIVIGIGLGAHFGGALLASWMDVTAQFAILPAWFYIYRVSLRSPLALEPEDRDPGLQVGV